MLETYESTYKNSMAMELLRYMDFVDDITIVWRHGREWLVTVGLKHAELSPSLTSAIAAVFLSATYDDYKDNGPPTAIVGTTLK